MKRILIITLLLMLSAPALFAQSNDQEKPKTTPEIAAERADELQKYLKLEDYQVFQVDSTLLHDLQAMQNEVAGMQKAGITNTDFYTAVLDRWYNTTDSTFQCIFSPEQWTRYLKSNYGKAKRQRDKRIAAWKAKTEGAKAP